MGDFNYPDIDWARMHGSSSFSSLFCDFLFDCNLHQLVSSSTHRCRNTLDLIITNIPDKITSISIHESISIPNLDHFLISFTILGKFSFHPSSLHVMWLTTLMLTSLAFPHISSTWTFPMPSVKRCGICLVIYQGCHLFWLSNVYSYHLYSCQAIS